MSVSKTHDMMSCHTCEYRQTDNIAGTLPPDPGHAGQRDHTGEGDHHAWFHGKLFIHKNGSRKPCQKILYTFTLNLILGSGPPSGVGHIGASSLVVPTSHVVVADNFPITFVVGNSLH